VIAALAIMAVTYVIRDHYLVAERNRHRVYEVTRIHDQEASLVTRTFLIADGKGPFLRVNVVSDVALHTYRTSYALLRGSKARATITTASATTVHVPT